MDFNELSLDDLYKMRKDIQQTIENRLKSLRNSVSVERQDRTYYLKHPNNGTYICKQAAYKGRWRMWKMVPGQRGLKRGPVVVEESFSSSIDDLENLKIHVALGYYKDK